MFPSLNQFVKSLVLIVILGYLLALDSSEARGLQDQQQQQHDDNLNYNQGDIQQQQQQLEAAVAAAQQQPPMVSAADAQNLENLDLDDDDDDDDRADQQQPQQSTMANGKVAAGSDIYQTDQSYQPPYQPAATQDLRTAASKHHHHKHGAKGWLDMGAWTGKKGAFGWYDKHPVGKGRK